MTSVRQSLRFADMVETATNDVGPLASIAATCDAPVTALRAATASDENVPGLLLRVYEDFCDRIALSRQTTYSEVEATVTSDLSTNIDQLETAVDSLNSECRSLRIRLAAAEDRLRDLETSPASTAPLENITTPTPPMASVPYPIPNLPVNHAYKSQVGASSQIPTTPHISTPISHSNVSAATPYPANLPHQTIPNNNLSQPVTYEQFLRGELPKPTPQLHPSHSPSSLHKTQPRTRYTLSTVSPDSIPNAPCFRFSPPSNHTRPNDSTINEPYSPPTRISNFIVSCENSKDSSRRSRRSTVRTRSRSFAISRS